jgi:hypothetical protein
LSNKHREEINNRFDDIVSRLDATQRAEASIRQMLGLIMQERNARGGPELAITINDGTPSHPSGVSTSESRRKKRLIDLTNDLAMLLNKYNGGGSCTRRR